MTGVESLPTLKPRGFLRNTALACPSVVLPAVFRTRPLFRLDRLRWGNLDWEHLADYSGGEIAW